MLGSITALAVHFTNTQVSWPFNEFFGLFDFTIHVFEMQYMKKAF
jgi:hypothetical protein